MTEQEIENQIREMVSSWVRTTYPETQPEVVEEEIPF